ncbi:soluble lytic murein transglycosylase-like protein, partial [Leptothrix ochracea L12]
MTSCFRLKPLALLMGTVLTLLSSLGTASAAVHPDGALTPSPIRPLLPPTLGQGLPVIPALLLRPGEDPILTSVESLEPPPLLRDPLLTVIPPLLAAPMGLMAESEPAPSSPITSTMAPQGSVSSDAMDGFFSPVDPIDPKRIPRLGDASIHTDLWSRVRSGFGMGTMSSGALSNLVQQHEQRFTAQADLLNKALERGSRYLFHIVDEVQKRGMPTELALLPFIESAFNPQATSSARATGMWQFMARTGRHLDLKQNMFRDDRRDVLASTRAALDYLTQLKQRFGTWPLALAA